MTAFTASMGAVRNGRWSEMRDVAEAQAALMCAQAMRWLRPLGELVDVANDDVFGVTKVSAADRETCERLVRAITLATRYGVFHPHCLTRAVALSRMLDAHGIRGHKIRIGVRRHEGAFIAHAWVEMGSSILGDTRGSTASYVPLTEMRVVGDGVFSRTARTRRRTDSARRLDWDQ